ncbi:putative glycosyltransferase [Halogeometricum borinquense DSM 11551]|uniref:Predicted glycosyltransferase n=1 Tax=Halogeometricum borinquense (strain ATCC 700274 / DSM 11551 / JCM 10706 / KCTC 4070 / PR3) TaxID=469382 RepID=E4NUH0_HALBP|nr:glycosyltransferase family 2 protein [Halogeometricum borinquense]ADQ68690.1 predicted glycosyltransferase [Halogeometricum borinquense DSM 11551]ELY25430.1 putative glycosyltransferase [Halogeometricum borinquense DSM 11551]
MTQPDVAGIILNWNNYKDTSECLRSLNSLEYRNFTPIVIDNGSTDGSGEKIREEFPDIDVCQTNQNLGFAGGMNVGINKALEEEFSYIWILNNDVLFSDDNVLGSLIQTLEAVPDAGAVTPIVRDETDSSGIWFKKGEINWKTATAVHSNQDSATNSDLIENQYIPLCSALFPASVFREVGLLPEDYFMYYEDLEYGVRVRNHGYKIFTKTSTSIIHDQGGTAGDQYDSLYSYYKPRNLILFSRKFNTRLDLMYPVCLISWVISEIGFRAIRGYAVSPFIIGLLHGILGNSGKGKYPK